MQRTLFLLFVFMRKSERKREGGERGEKAENWRHKAVRNRWIEGACAATGAMVMPKA